MRQELGEKDPIVLLQLVSTYLTSFYGSNLWDLYGDTTERLFKTWNVMVRFIFDLSRKTHKYLIESISQTSHLKVKLTKRFLKFSNTLSNCDKPHLKYLQDLQYNDRRSVYGRNVQNICEEAGAELLCEVDISSISYESIPIE